MKTRTLTTLGGKIIILDVSMGSSTTQEERKIHNRIGIAREGLPFAGMGLAITLLFLFIDVAALAVVAGALTRFVL